MRRSGHRKPGKNAELGPQFHDRRNARSARVTGGRNDRTWHHFWGTTLIWFPSGSSTRAYHPQGRFVGGRANLMPLCFHLAHIISKSPGTVRSIPVFPGSSWRSGRSEYWQRWRVPFTPLRPTVTQCPSSSITSRPRRRVYHSTDLFRSDTMTATLENVGLGRRVPSRRRALLTRRVVALPLTPALRSGGPRVTYPRR